MPSLVVKNVDLCKILFSENRDRMFLRALPISGEEASMCMLGEQYPKSPPKQLHISNGSLSIIEDWINSGMQDSPEELGDYMNKITRKVLSVLK